MKPEKYDFFQRDNRLHFLSTAFFCQVPYLLKNISSPPIKNQTHLQQTLS